jgi:hypothetical protein
MNSLTKSGHKIIKQSCFSEYIKSFNKEYKEYEYFISDSNILYIYEDGLFIKSERLTTPECTFDNWAKYFIQDLINKSISN